MEKEYKIRYKTASGYERTTTVIASSKYDAKKRFYRERPKCEIIKVEAKE